jgi:hypothetical protein
LQNVKDHLNEQRFGPIGKPGAFVFGPATDHESVPAALVEKTTMAIVRPAEQLSPAAWAGRFGICAEPDPGRYLHRGVGKPQVALHE